MRLGPINRLHSKWAVIGIFLALPVWSSPSAGSTFRDVLTMDASDVALGEANGFDVITLAGGRATGSPGRPAIPVMALQYRVPPGKRVKGVKVLDARWVSLGSGLMPLPVQPQARAGESVDFVPPRSEDYLSSQWYPSSAIEYTGGGYLRGRRIEGFVLRPVRYRGEGGRLEYLSRLEIEVELEDAGSGALKVSRALRGVEEGIDAMLGDVTRGVTVEGQSEWMEREGVRMEEEAGVDGGFMPSLLPDVEGSAVEYVIVTNDAMSGEFQRLADWKRQKGVGAVVKTVSWIQSNYPNGVDLAETIRFFLQDAYKNWGTVWVLLGGDTDVIPIRYAYSHRYGEAAPTDVYYSCLDGDWNGDGDDLWGEGISGLSGGDSPDLYPEVFVGRAPANTPEEAAVFVDKVIGYEKNPPIGYQNKALVFAEVLFPANWDGRERINLDGASLAETAISALPPEFEVSKFYENYTDSVYVGASPLSKDVIVGELNKGYGIAHHVGHGFRTTMSVGAGVLHNPDITALRNGSKVSVVTALNCDAAAVDYNCIGEAFLLNPQGGGVAYLGATRFEFPTTVRGYQDELYKLIFRHGVSRMGRAVSWARLLFVPGARGDDVSHWSQFVHILLGDPELTVWTAVPSSLEVSLPDEIGVGLGTLAANVSSGGAPVEGAVVTCSKAGEVYSIGRTDGSGDAAVGVSPDTPGALTLTVTATNHLPFETQVPVTAATGAHVHVQSMTLDDGTGGDGDGLPERGETFDLLMTLVNDGTAGSPQVTGVLAFEEGAGLQILQDSVSTPGLAAAATVVPPPFRVKVLPSAVDGRRVMGRAVFSTSQGGSDYNFSLYLGAPKLEIYETTVDDSEGGDGDGTAEPGESVLVKVLLSNAGRGSGRGVYALLEAAGGGAFVSADSVYYGSVHGSAVEGDGEFKVEMGTDPEPAFALTFHDSSGVLGQRDFDLSPPGPPSSLSGYGDEGSARLVWAPGGEDDLEGYIIYRSSVQGGPYSRVTPSPLMSSSTYEDGGLLPLAKYFYAVASQDSSGNLSALSLEAPVSTNPPKLAGWPQYLDIETAAGVNLADLDGDGDLEVIAAGGEVYAYHYDGEEVTDGDHRVITHGVFSDVSYSPVRGFWSTPAAADLDGDGFAEIAANYWDDGLTYLWNGADAAVEAEWPVGSSQFAWSSPSIGDIDNDGSWDIVSGGGTGAVYAWHFDGSEVADGDGDPTTTGVLVDHGSKYSYGSTALVDLDGDGADEVIAGLRDGTLLAVRGDGSSYPGFPYSTGKSIVSTPCAADVDGDGDVEIVVAVGSKSQSSGSAVHVVNVTPAVARQWKMEIPLDQDFNSSPAVGDLDGDGGLEIVIGGGDGRVYALRGADGMSLPGWPVKTGGAIQGSASIADIDGDGYPDVLIGDEDGLLHCLSHDGSSLPGFPIQLAGAVRAAPVVWDINGDGLVDILCQAMDKTIHAWTYDGAFDPSPNHTPWPMFLHDPRHTSHYETQMPFPVRISSWELQAGDGGVVMSWTPAGWDGRGRWAVYRSGGGADALSSGPREIGPGGDRARPASPDAPSGAGVASRAASSPVPGHATAPAPRARKLPAFLSMYRDVTALGLFSAQGRASLSFKDPAPGSGVISYVLELVRDDGTVQLFGPRTVLVEGGAPPGPRLLSVSPNPFSTSVGFTLFVPERGDAGGSRTVLRVFDAAGRTVRSLSWEGLGAGPHRLVWDGRDGSGGRLGAGVYFYSFEAGGRRSSGKLLLVR